MPTTGYTKIRAALELTSATGSPKIQAAVQYSDDGSTWETPVLVSPVSPILERTTDGVSYSVYFDFPANEKTFARFGVRCINSSGTGFSGGLAALRLELK